MNDFKDMPDVLTMPECQEVLRIGRSTAYQLIRSGKLQCIRIGRSIRIPKKYILEFIEAQHGPGNGACPAQGGVDEETQA